MKIILTTLLIIASIPVYSSEMSEKCKDVVSEHSKSTVLNKVDAVNSFTSDFFVDFESERDVWKTPSESLESMEGSLYDLAVLRYFMLRDMGIKDSHLKLNYGNSQGLNVPNLVVDVYDSKAKKRYLMDYLEGQIINKFDHKSFDSLYRFDQKYLWTTRGYSGVSSQISPWQGMLERKEDSFCK